MNVAILWKSGTEVHTN